MKFVKNTHIYICLYFSCFFRFFPRFFVVCFCLSFFSCFFFLKKKLFFFACVSFHFFVYLLGGSGRRHARYGRSRHQPTNQSFRVCKVDLATLKVAITEYSYIFAFFFEIIQDTVAFCLFLKEMYLLMPPWFSCSWLECVSKAPVCGCRFDKDEEQTRPNAYVWKGELGPVRGLSTALDQLSALRAKLNGRESVLLCQVTLLKDSRTAARAAERTGGQPCEL